MNSSILIGVTENDIRDRRCKERSSTVIQYPPLAVDVNFVEGGDMMTGNGTTVEHLIQALLFGSLPKSGLPRPAKVPPAGRFDQLVDP
jgi:hypothetical protein